MSGTCPSAQYNGILDRHTMSDTHNVRHAQCQTRTMSDTHNVRHAQCQTHTMSDMPFSLCASTEATHRDDCPRPVHHIDSHLDVPLCCLGAFTEGSALQSHVDVITGISYSENTAFTLSAPPSPLPSPSLPSLLPHSPPSSLPPPSLLPHSPPSSTIVTIPGRMTSGKPSLWAVVVVLVKRKGTSLRTADSCLRWKAL